MTTPLMPIRPSRRSDSRAVMPRGQVLVIAAGILTVLIALVGLIVDLGWYQVNVLRVQRSADAAALAGVVYLPAAVSNAQALAYAEATKNGYTTTGGTTTVAAAPDPFNPRKLDVQITTQVPTFFIKILGINSLTVVRTSSAEFVLPVPMGSPLNYYGVGCMDTNGSQPACTTAGNSNGLSGVPDATTGSSVTGAGAPSQLDSQGFWGAVFTRGGDARNGDAYSTLNYSGGLGGGPGSNVEYDPSGYGYTVEIPAGGGGAVYVYDPMFCGMPQLGSGRAGTGDEWTGALGGASNPAPVTTYYNVWNTNGTPTPVDDTLVYTSANLFVRGLNNNGVNYVDLSGKHGSGSPQYTSGVSDCDQAPANSYHLRWWPVPTGALAQGVYRLQVTTTNVVLPPLGSSGSGGGTVPAASQPSDAVGAANRFSLEVTSASGNPRVYGGGRMAAYTNMQSGTQAFYLAQIDQASGRGKTIQINLYDPGDVGGGAWLQFLNPDGGSYTPATFSFTSRSKAGQVGPSGTNVTCIETNRPGGAPSFAIPAGCPRIFDGAGSQFDSYWLTITIPLPNTYGNSGLQPAGTPAPGWWKVQYTVAGGNDTTTWSVNILGNPVHLVLP